MKVGILGSGKIVQMLTNTIRKLPFEKIYILGREGSRQRVEALAAEYGFDGTFYDYDALLDADVDTIYVALPNSLHYPFAKKAMERGKNVIIEKPITANARELKDLMETARRMDVLMVEAMSTHSLPAYKALKADLPAVGRVRVAAMNFSQYSSRYDAFLRGETIPAFDPGQAGGALMDLNVYNLHALLGLFGPPESVHYRANVVRGIDTSGVLTLGYPDLTAVCVAAKDCQSPAPSAIQGEKGALLMDRPVSQITGYRFRSTKGEERTFEVEGSEYQLYYEFMDFIAMFDAHDRARADKALEISLWAMEVLDKAREQAGIVFDTDGES